MSSTLGFVSLCSLGIPIHHPTASCKPHSLSRRAVLITLGTIPLFKTVPVAGEHLPSDARSTAKLIREQCSQFISLIHPVIPNALLWRGADSGKDFTVRSSPSDLLMEETYGAAGASFFRDLDHFLLGHEQEDTVRPSRAHIGTGDPHIAANWGTPVSIWPAGQLRFAYWRDSSLIYEDGETLEASRNRGGQLVFDKGLRHALIDGKEVMFEAQTFFEVSGQLTASVLERLSGSK